MMDAGGPPGVVGRPITPVDIDVVRCSAAIGCTVDEIAAVLDMPTRTLYDRLKQDPRIQLALDEGRQQGRTTLRRLQWQQANDGNTTMLIWLGKQMLGQRDKHELTEDPERPTLQFQHLVAMKAFSDQLAREREVVERQPLVIDGDAINRSNTSVSTTRNLFEPAIE